MVAGLLSLAGRILSGILSRRRTPTAMIEALVLSRGHGRRRMGETGRWRLADAAARRAWQLRHGSGRCASCSSGA